jgi:hypothetical protein
LAQATQRSALATLCAAATPVITLAFAGFRSDISIPVAVLTAIGAVIGWIAGLAAVKHPLWNEVRDILRPALQAVTLRLLKNRAKA